MISRENLIYVVFCDNCCWAEVVTEKPKGITVSLKKGSWKFKKEKLPSELRTHWFPIGQGNDWLPSGFIPPKGHCIGVFDKTNVKHLSQMVHIAIAAIRFRE